MIDMQQDLSQFLYHLQNTLEGQQEAIHTLQEQLMILKRELMELQQKPTVRVDRIEYKFDQLKVERLDGTLNIGLTPGELQGIDEFAVNQKQLNPYLFPARDELVERLSREAFLYLEQNKESIFQKAERISNQTADSTMRSFIMEDLSRQLPTRINYYIDQTPIQRRNERDLGENVEQISEAIKTDIETAIIRFMEAYPESMKEEQQ